MAEQDARSVLDPTENLLARDSAQDDPSLGGRVREPSRWCPRCQAARAHQRWVKSITLLAMAMQVE